MIDQTPQLAILDRSATRPWDYEVVSIHARHNNVLQEALKEKGQQGWELAFINMPMPNEYQCVFRRQD